MKLRVATICVVLVSFSAFAEAAVEVVVHRGDNANAPENTLAAAKRCVALGADYVEIDVRRSKDGVHYILHDPTVDRTTDGSGPIAEMTSEEVDALDAGSWFSEDFAGEVVPRLDPFLAWAKGKIKIYFDVKDADLRHLVDLVEKHDLREECFFWFGDHSVAKTFREIAPTLELKINAAIPRAVEWADKEFDATIIECSVRSLTPEFVEVCRSRGMRIMVREGDPDEDAFRKTIASGADLINLDHPELFIEVQSRVLNESQE